MTTPPNTPQRNIIRPIEPPPEFTPLLGPMLCPEPFVLPDDVTAATRYTATCAAIQDGDAVH